MERMRPLGTCVCCYIVEVQGRGVTMRKRIREGTLGAVIEDRIPLIERIHAALSTWVAAGAAKSTVVNACSTFYMFCAWVDEAGGMLAIDTCAALFRDWTEVLLRRVRAKELLYKAAYHHAARCATLLVRAVGALGESAGTNMAAQLLSQTRMQPLRNSKNPIGTNSDKQNLQKTFEFGHLLTDLCLGLGIDVIRGPLPVVVTLRDGRRTQLKSGLRRQDIVSQNGRVVRIEAQAEGAPKVRVSHISRLRRAALSGDEAIVDNRARASLLTLRVEAEMLMFVAQTGMNISQAAALKREDYRWKTEGEDAIALRVHKGRRGGEVIFRCFKVYRAHLERYLEWIDRTGMGALDERLFPILHTHFGKFPAEKRTLQFYATRAFCKALGVTFFGPRQLRKTRVNWLLRKSRDPDITADMAAHTKETLLRDYEQPNHQVAVMEILRFHEATDPTIQPPGPGRCVSKGRQPEPIPGCLPQAPQPDCSSPEGCLFCTHHRDVLSGEYCWKLASHRRLKLLEVAFWRPQKGDVIHPANLVVDRVTAKLEKIREGSAVRAQWVNDAEGNVRAGLYHPIWDMHITVFEALA